MKALIFRHIKACSKNLRFGLILSLGIFAFTFLIYLSTVCGNLKETGIADSEVFPYMILTFIGLTALVPAMSDISGQSLKKDTDSGFDKFMLASPISIVTDVLSLYLSVMLVISGFILLSEIYVTVFICMGVLPADISGFIVIFIVGIFDVIYAAVQIPFTYAKFNSTAVIFIVIAVSEAIGVGISMLVPKSISADPLTMFRSIVAAAPVLWVLMPMIVPVLLFGISFILSIKFRKGRLYCS